MHNNGISIHPKEPRTHASRLSCLQIMFSRVKTFLTEKEISAWMMSGLLSAVRVTQVYYNCYNWAVPINYQPLY